MKLSDFYFELPAERIALRPAMPRDGAGMLVVRPDGGERFIDDRVSNLARYLRAGDVLVVNDTKVIPAALRGARARAGSVARISVNLVERLDDRRWAAFARPMKRLSVGDVVTFGPSGGGFAASVEAKTEDGRVLFAFDRAGAELDAALAEHGAMPLPPYIAGKRAADASDDADYQTMFAARSGAVAAPTAGLHFTERLLQGLAARGVGRATLTLHVGAGTFLPVKSERIEQHRMHAEYGEIGDEAAAALNAAKAAGGRLVAVGTTSLRLLESAARADGTIEPLRGQTDIFIVPGYRFKAVDLLMTNFHLPKSTLFMLVCAFSGTECMKAAYAHALARDYRFYSYGDACLLHPEPQAR